MMWRARAVVRVLDRTWRMTCRPSPAEVQRTFREYPLLLDDGVYPLLEDPGRWAAVHSACRVGTAGGHAWSQETFDGEPCIVCYNCGRAVTGLGWWPLVLATATSWHLHYTRKGLVWQRRSA